MTRGNLQLAGRNPLEKRVVTISQPHQGTEAVQADDSLFLNVLRRRWLLLTVCTLTSVGAAVYAATHYTMPSAETQGELRYVALPPALQQVYQAPNTLELAEMLGSNENLATLAQRSDLQIDPKSLTPLLDIKASHLSNIISVKLKWSDAQQAIEMVNELMDIAVQTTSESRRETLGRYRKDTEIALATANQRVQEFRDRAITLRQERDAQLREEGSAGTEVQRLTSVISRIEDLLDQAILTKAKLSQQLMSVRSEVESIKGQIRQELLRSRQQQVELRLRALSRTSPQAGRLLKLQQRLAQFEEENRALDYVAWEAKLSVLGREVLGGIDPATLRAIETIEQNLNYKQRSLERLELDLLPMDNEISMLEKRRASQERRLSEALSSEMEGLPNLEEAELRLDEAQNARRSLQEQLDNIKRLEDTEFSEMTVLTPASWRTTEANEGRHKVFVFTLAGCLALLTLPVFALEHFFPSGDPAERAAKSLGLPLIGRGTFVAQQLRHDKVPIHPVNSESLRLLALRIQQSVHGPGSLVLFSGLNHAKSSIPTISYLAECLARREERVLIIDACDRPGDSRQQSRHEDLVKTVLAPSASTGVAPASPECEVNRPLGSATDLVPQPDPEPSPGLVGLSDFLHRRDLSPDEMICRTSIPGVDMIPSGSTTFPCEGLAAGCLTDLLDECRRRYTIILVAGPSTQQPSDLQMLSARADAILFTLPKNGRPNAQGDAIVQELMGLGAPVIGIVS